MADSEAQIPNHLIENDLFVSVAAAFRWWTCFDAGQLALCRITGTPKVGHDDVRRIARNYLFLRNIPNDPDILTMIAEEVNRFSNMSWDRLSDRALEIRESINRLHSSGAMRFRLISGMTKLTWFVSPDNWTPFDRLASFAVGATQPDRIGRMLQFYELLDERDFLSASTAIQSHLDAYNLGQIRGERVLDKLLMIAGHRATNDDKSADEFRNMAMATAASLPLELRRPLFAVGEEIAKDGKCQFGL